MKLEQIPNNVALTGRAWLLEFSRSDAPIEWRQWNEVVVNGERKRGFYIYYGYPEKLAFAVEEELAFAVEEVEIPYPEADTYLWVEDQKHWLIVREYQYVEVPDETLR